MIRFLLYLAICLTFNRGSELSSVAISRIKSKESLVHRFVHEAELIFARRGKEGTSCGCSEHVCRLNLTKSICQLTPDEVINTCNATDCALGTVTYVETPPDVDSELVSPQLTETICTYQQMESILSKLDPNPRTTTRISTHDGLVRTYPGERLRFILQKGKTDCKSYDPRLKSYYAGAAIGPKDIVFVIDSTEEMSRPWRKNISRLEFVSSAIKLHLKSFSEMDRLNVVAVSDKAYTRGTEQRLYSGSKQELYLMGQTISALSPWGKGSISQGIKLAFSLLLEDHHWKRKGSHKVIIVVAGSSIRFRGRNVQLLKKLEKLQSGLERVSGSRAKIFTYSIGENVDHDLLKQIVCRNNGAWFLVNPKEDLFKSLNLYGTFLDSLKNNPIWSDFHRSRILKDKVATVAQSFYYHPAKRQPSVLLGVVNHEVTLSELLVNGTTEDDIKTELMRRSRRHLASDTDLCQLQVYRNVYANGSICSDIISVAKSERKKESRRRSNKEDQACFGHLESFYKIFSKPLSRDKASESCRIDGGRLAEIETNQQLAFLESLASVDGSWVSSDLRLDRIAPELHYKLEETKESNQSCLRLTNGAAQYPLREIDCDEDLSYICVYDSERHCSRVIFTPKEGFFAIPALDSCISVEETLANVLLSGIEARVPSSDLWCSSDDTEQICCRNCMQQ